MRRPRLGVGYIGDKLGWTTMHGLGSPTERLAVIVPSVCRVPKHKSI
jgi:hypothetical protein